ncbi:hypothetical protein L0Y65_05770 [Candidatus Micrarchaeota archaeon]|nr:hypothetical protein [Candidatus Micrarchaeota archaeon]
MVKRKKSEMALPATLEITRAEFLQMVFGDIAPGQDEPPVLSLKPDEKQCDEAPAVPSGAMPKIRKW